MSWYRRSLRVKLLTGFGAVILVLVGMIALSLSATGSLADEADTIGKSDLPSVQTIGAIDAAEKDYRISQAQHILATDAATMRMREGKLRTLDATIDKAFASYGRLASPGEDRRQWAAARAGWKAYHEHTPPILAASRAGDDKRATAELNGDTLKEFQALGAGLKAWDELNAKAAADSVAKATSTAASARRTLIVVGLLAAAFAIGIALLLARSIVSGVKQVLVAAEGMAEGDLDQDVQVASKDEIGQMAAAFGRLTAYVKEMAGAADSIARGDLSTEITPRSERDVLGVAFRDMRGNLSQLVGAVAQSSQTLSSASQQMAMTSQEAGNAVGEIAHAVSDVAQGAERQARTVESTREQTEQMSQATATGAENVRETAGAAVDARKVAAEGARAVEQATAAMDSVRESSAAVTETIRRLGDKSGQIGGIVDTITGIAGQTNLLALNAAIEAARAGEQGRGFAVVAEQVRKLAEESQAATASIATLVADIQAETAHAVEVVEDGARRTEDGAETVGQAREAFLAIGGSVDDMASRVDAIATIMQQIAVSSTRVQEDMTEVAAVAEQSSASSEEVSASTEQTSASAQQIAASAQELATTAEQLAGLVGRFTLAKH